MFAVCTLVGACRLFRCDLPSPISSIVSESSRSRLLVYEAKSSISWSSHSSSSTRISPTATTRQSQISDFARVCSRTAHFAADNRLVQRLQSGVCPCRVSLYGPVQFAIIGVLGLSGRFIHPNLPLALRGSSPLRNTLFIGPSPLILYNAMLMKEKTLKIDCLCSLVTTLIRPKFGRISSGEYCKYSVGQKNRLHAFGCNSAESEPIWIKFRTLWANCWGAVPGRLCARSAQLR